MDAYTVLEINERTRINDLNRVERYYQVRARTAKGTVFTATLGESQVAPKESRDILTARAKALDALKD